MLAGPDVPVAPPPVELYVAFEGESQRKAAFAVTAEARDARVNAQMELAGRSRKGQLKQADRLGARYVAIIGEEGTVLRDMQGQAQLDVQAGEVVTRILRDRGLR
jgi:histidyl-tRNA synthetase